VSATGPTPLSFDSTGAISIAWDPMKHEPTKHIGVDASYMRSIRLCLSIMCLQRFSSQISSQRHRLGHTIVICSPNINVVDTP
jgi:hypothetical protein